MNEHKVREASSLTESLTDKEKIDRIKEIVEGNLYPIFTAFALDLNTYPNSKTNLLEQYVELKELLNISPHSTTRDKAIKYDKFKESNKDKYLNLIKKLDNRMIELYKTGGAPFHKGKSLSTYMFMTAMYPIFFNHLLDNIEENYDKAIKNIETFEFYSG